MRPRKKDRHLPSCVFLRRGVHYFVQRGKWINLGRDETQALIEAARLRGRPEGGMDRLIDAAMPTVKMDAGPTTRKKYDEVAAKLKDIFAEFAPHQVTPNEVRRMLRAYAKHPATGNRLLVILRGVMDYACEEDIISVNPCAGIKSLPQRERTRLVTPAEFQAIRAKAKPRHQVVMDLCYLTGQRIGDVLKIKRTDCTDIGIHVEQEKTGKRLVIGWTPDLKAAVEAAKALHGAVPSLYVIKGVGGEPMSYTVAWKDWRAACKLAKVEGANLHDLRAMAATEAEEQGADPQKLLGHKDAGTTRRYLRARKVSVVTGPKFRKA